MRRVSCAGRESGSSGRWREPVTEGPPLSNGGPSVCQTRSCKPPKTDRDTVEPRRPKGARRIPPPCPARAEALGVAAEAGADAAAYATASPAADELSTDEEALAWDAEGREEFRAHEGAR